VVTILSDTAERAKDLDEASAQAAKQRAEQVIADHRSDFEYARAKAELAEAIAQLQAIERLRKLRKSG
jgi:F-type H+-transporting ATPase subunit epsilon